MAKPRKSRPDITGMTSLKVDNIPFGTKYDDLKRLFEKFGEIGDVHIPRDRDTKESYGFAYVRFYDARDARDAKEGMHGRVYENKELRVDMDRSGRSEVSCAAPPPQENKEEMEVTPT